MSRTRLTAEERQDQIIAAAVTAFSHAGYAGTTTDQVARIAGISQPYVIRMFRTKQELFIATVTHAGNRIEETFRAAAASEPTLASLGNAYDELLAERALITLLLHGFTASSDPAIGEPVRACFGRIFDSVREATDCSAEEARDFFARGMLLTCLGAMRVIGPDPVPPTPWMADLIQTLDEKQSAAPGNDSLDVARYGADGAIEGDLAR